MKQKITMCAKLFVLFACLVSVLFVVDNAQAQKKTKKKAKAAPSLAKAVLTLSKTSYTYNGKERKPSVTVKIKKKKINKKYYTVTYSDNKYAGTAKVVVKANALGKTKKICKSKKSITFKITKADRTIISDKESYSAVEDDASFDITAKASKGNGNIVFTSSNETVLSITASGHATPKNAGIVNVTASVRSTKNYKAATKNIPVTINKIPTFNIDCEKSIKEFSYLDSKVLANCFIEMGCTKAAPLEPPFDMQNFTYKPLTSYTWSVIDKYNVPGLAPTVRQDLFNGSVECKDLCPQGMCTAGDYLLLTAYCTDSLHNSCILIYDKLTGAFLNTLVLKNKCHAGGIAYDGTNLWICQPENTTLQKISFSALKKCANGSKKVVKIESVGLPAEDNDITSLLKGKPSAIAYQGDGGYDDGEYLWVAAGEAPSTATTGTTAKTPYMIAYRCVDGKLETVPEYLYGKVHDYLGMSTADTADNSDEEKPSAPPVSTGSAIKGVMVTEIVKKSPATSIVLENDEKTSVIAGDIITHFDEKEITSQKEFEKIMDSVNDGDKKKITIVRADKDGANETLKGTITVKFTDRTVKTENGVPVYKKVKIPCRVQGLTFKDNGDVIFSMSNGRNLTKKHYISQLLVTTMDENDELIYKSMVLLPPMIEEVEMQENGELYMLFESAGIKYYNGTDNAGTSDSPIDKIISVSGL